jgi:hypothetical protein
VNVDKGVRRWVGVRELVGVRGWMRVDEGKMVEPGGWWDRVSLGDTATAFSLPFIIKLGSILPEPSSSTIM